MVSFRVNHRAIMGLVEAAHDGDGDWEGWAERLATAARRVFGTNSSAILGIRNSSRYELLAGVAHPREARRYWSGACERTPAYQLDPFWRYPGYVATTEGVLAGQAPPQDLANFCKRFAVKDILGLVGIVDEYSFSIGVSGAERIRLRPVDRYALLRAAVHIESGLRARLHPGDAVAWIRPDGSVLSANSGLTQQVKAREALSEHVKQVERHRTHRLRAESIDAWQALVGGRWALVQQEQAGCGRYYAVLEVRSSCRLRALNRLETQVVELSARGLDGKNVGYALGVTPGAVSKCLGRACLKLGIPNRVELVRLMASLTGVDKSRDTGVTLTTVEREILDLVRLGWTNSAIAKARDRSERTIANQVARLLRKFNVPTRRTLAALNLTLACSSIAGPAANA